MKRYINCSNEYTSPRAEAYRRRKYRRNNLQDEREAYAKDLEEAIAPTTIAEIRFRIFDKYRSIVDEYYRSNNLPILDDDHYGYVRLDIVPLADCMAVRVSIDAGQLTALGLLSLADIVTGGDGRLWFRGWSRCRTKVKRELESYAAIIRDLLESDGLDILDGPEYDSAFGMIFYVIDDGYEELV